MTLTDATLAEFEARVKGRRAYERRTVPPPLMSGSLYDLDEIDRLIAALRASRERERRLNDLLRSALYYVRDDALVGMIRAALGEEATS